MRLLAAAMAGLLVGTGCASSSYRIPSAELHRLGMTPPEQRAQRVLVSQEISATEVEPAETVSTGTQVVFVPDIHIGGSYGYAGPRRSGGGAYDGGTRFGGSKPTSSTPSGGKPSGGKGPRLGSGGGGGGAGDGKGAAIAVLVLAATGLFVLAAVEGSRFDGHVQLHPMHPVHLIGKDGTHHTVPLAWLDPQTTAWADKAVVRRDEGPWRELARKPLTRGLTYGMYAGSGSYRSVAGDVHFGPAFVVQAGYFPEQRVGLLANVALGWRDNRFGETLYDSRYMAELQALPLRLGAAHAGIYAGAGLAYRWEDVPGATIEGDNGSTAFTGGAMLQLELHTRIALTARMGAVKAHGDRMTDLLFGLSVY